MTVRKKVVQKVTPKPEPRRVEIQLRTMVQKDVKRAMEIEASNYLEFEPQKRSDLLEQRFTRQEWLNLLTGRDYCLGTKSAKCIVAHVGPLVVGFAIMNWTVELGAGDKPEPAEIFFLCVEKAWQGRKVGKTLLRGAVMAAATATDQPRGVKLMCHSENAAALTLYKTSGFEVQRTRRGYYKGGVFDDGDRVEMVLPVTAARRLLSSGIDTPPRPAKRVRKTHS